MPKPIIHVDGRVDPRFAIVEQAFRRNFVNEMEKAGAALAVYLDGELVVDLWGGYADVTSGRLWRSDTMAIVFSTSKAVGALAMAKLIDQNLVQYQSKVIEYWPEFGKHGKDACTIRHILEHQAAVAAIDTPLTLDIMADHKKISAIIEDQKPNWPVGTVPGYHACTYGWLVDQLVRRIDPKHRGIGQFVREELNEPDLEPEFYFGLPDGLSHKVARIQAYTGRELLKMIVNNISMVTKAYGVLLNRNEISKRAMSNPNLGDSHKIRLNDPDYYKLEQCAFNGIGTARGLARIFVPISQHRKMAPDLIDELASSARHVEVPDKIISFPMPRANGFMMNKHPQDDKLWLFGHPGYGGQQLKVDLKNKMVIAYITNKLQPAMGDMTPTYRPLQNAIYNCLGQPFKPI